MSQWARNVETTSHQRRCNMTLHHNYNFEAEKYVAKEVRDICMYGEIKGN